METLKETHLNFLGKKKIGKVRDIYKHEDKLVLITTDRHSSFDRIIALIPSKGQVLNQSSAWWFENTQDIIPNHVIAIPDPNVTIAKKLRPVPIEAVMRGYLTGVTSTSIWTRYSQGQRVFGDMTLDNDLQKNVPLPQPLFDPTTKEDLHDRVLSIDQMIEEGFVTSELYELICDISIKLFTRGQEIAAERGLILVDTKYEFGIDDEKQLYLIDEIHTPDSSRYWQRDSYWSRLANNEEPEYFDKEFLRLWFKENSDPYVDAILPAAPQDMIEEMSRRYTQMYKQMTGETFIPGEVPIEQRIEHNVKTYFS